MISPAQILPTAVRAYTAPSKAASSHRGQPGPVDDAPVLVFDTESRTDPTQRLTFGCWRVLLGGETVDEGLFSADDLPAIDYAVLAAYARSHRADTATREPVRLLSRRDFLREVFWKVAYRARGTVVGFNLPFDLARIGSGWGDARGDFYGGGFSLSLWDYQRGGVWAEDKYRPRLSVKTIDSKRALMGFGKRRSPDQEDLIPEGGEGGEPDPKYAFPGHFLDLRTLAFALTNQPYSLQRACEAFGVAHGKQAVERHGELTPQYVDYARRDVLATTELLGKLLAEHRRHPIDLAPTKAFSPASVGKAYLRAMGIRPVLERQPDFPKDVLGWAMAAYYGGRAECRIRKVGVPVTYVDYLSMYSSVNILMGLWCFLVATRIETDNATEDARRLLAEVDLDRCFDPALWPELPVLVQVEPDGDVLPVRAKYGKGDAWQIGLNVLADGEARWHTLADCVAAALLAGKPPRVLRAVRLVPSEERLPGLRPVRLRRTVEVDPATEDFFRAVIEQRKSLPPDLPAEERSRTGAFLKVVASATGYGIFAEMNRKDSDSKPVEVEVFGQDNSSFLAEVTDPEEPGEFSFPPLAAFIAGAARLMLAMLERCVTDLGGTYAMCDTDSMAIVANVDGGPIPCPGGTHRLRRKPAVRALSWPQVDAVVDRFAALNPYDPAKVPGSILEVEGVNFDGDGKRRELRCYAVSAKRYALYVLDGQGEPVVVDGKEHGLGHLLNPTDPDAEDRAWIAGLWRGILRDEAGLDPWWPSWLDRPALTRLTISSPALLRPFAGMDDGKTYVDQVKPFNFLLTAHVARLGQPEGVDLVSFQLVAPYEAEPNRWLRLPWVDRSSGERYRVATSPEATGPDVARIKTYRDVLAEFRSHPEAKSAAPEGRPCDRRTAGLLDRRIVRSVRALTTHVGKESNRLEEVEAGVEHDPDEVWTEYRDPNRDPWRTSVLPMLREMRLADVAAAAGISDRAARAVRNGHARPRANHRAALQSVAARYAAAVLVEAGLSVPTDDLAACVAVVSLRAQSDTSPASTVSMLPRCDGALGQPMSPASDHDRGISQWYLST